MIIWWRFLIRLFITIALAINITFVLDHMHKPLIIHQEVAMTNATALDVAKQLLTTKNFICLKKIITVESHDNPQAKNPGSSARGVGQLLASTYRNLGLKHSQDAKGQVVAMMAYISERYGKGGPCAAFDFERHHNYF